MGRVKHFINRVDKTVLDSTITKQGSRGTDQAKFSLLPSCNVVTNDDFVYLQDIIDLGCLCGFYGFEKSVGDQSGHCNHIRGFVNVPSALSRFEFECNLTCTGTGNNNGTMAAGCETYVTGKVGCKAFCFEGTRYITVANECEYDIERDNKFSISAWVKMPCASASANEMIIGKSVNATTGLGWKLNYRSDDLVTFRIGDGTSQFIVNSVATFNDCTFHHVVATYSGNSNQNGMKIYVDGVLDASGTASAISCTILNNCVVSFGATSGGVSRFTGVVDDIYIFKDKELTRDQVNALYLRGKTNYVAGKQGCANCFDGCTSFEIKEGEIICPAPCNLISHWKLEGDVLDSKGCNCGTLVGCCNIFSTSKVGDFSLHSPVSNHVTTTSSPFDFEHTEDFSISGWYYHDVACGSNNRTFFAKSNDLVTTVPSSWGMRRSDSTGWTFRMVDGVCNQFEVSSGACFDDFDRWWHVVVTYNGTTKNIKMYVDNSLKNCNTATFTATIRNSLNFSLSADSDGSRSSNSRIDDVRIYNKELTAANVTQLFKLPFDYEYTCNFSISTWFNSTNSCLGIIYGKGIVNAGIEMRLRACPNDIQLTIANSSGNRIRATTTTGGLNDGCWHNIVATYDGTGLASGVTFYLCGVLDCTVTITDTLCCLSIRRDEPPVISGLTCLASCFWYLM